MAFGVNHMGHFLLTQRLLPALKAAAPARIVTLASRAHRRVDGIPFAQLRQPTRTATGIAEYSVSKLANLLFSAELARRLAGTDISTYAVHPGVVASDIWRTLPAPLRPLFHWLRRMVTVEEGARTPLLCATAPALAGQSGLYWSDGAPRNPARRAATRPWPARCGSTARTGRTEILVGPRPRPCPGAGLRLPLPSGAIRTL
jgi:NAD(P)-dependent dehydrogenase (short-subunit alcohol dehydrogenase family)